MIMVPMGNHGAHCGQNKAQEKNMACLNCVDHLLALELYSKDYRLTGDKKEKVAATLACHQEQKAHQDSLKPAHVARA